MNITAEEKSDAKRIHKSFSQFPQHGNPHKRLRNLNENKTTQSNSCDRFSSRIQLCPYNPHNTTQIPGAFTKILKKKISKKRRKMGKTVKALTFVNDEQNINWESSFQLKGKPGKHKRVSSVVYNGLVPSSQSQLTPLDCSSLALLKESMWRNPVAEREAMEEERKKVSARRAEYSSRKRSMTKTVILKRTLDDIPQSPSKDASLLEDVKSKEEVEPPKPKKSKRLRKRKPMPKLTRKRKQPKQ